VNEENRSGSVSSSPTSISTASTVTIEKGKIPKSQTRSSDNKVEIQEIQACSKSSATGDVIFCK
jgi:hypothetical protein